MNTAFHNNRVGPWLIALASLILFASNVQADNAWPAEEAGASTAGFTESGIDALDDAMKKIVADQDVAGMIWMLAKDGEVATFETAGLARVDDQAPMTIDSLFRIYSMTKPVTGVALMMLYEEGLWKFDDPISKYVPEFTNLKVMTSYDADGNMELVPLERQPTMRELLNHSAGFGYGLGGNDPVNNAFRDNGVLASDDLDQLIDKVADIALLFQPGEAWSYSVAVDIQGYIVQQLSGLKFGDFLEQRVFQPLGMSDTRFYVQANDRDRFAEVHNWDSERNRLVQRPHRPDRPSYLDPQRIESGGGGLVSSTHDYARFLQMLVNEGELDDARLLTPESVRIMRTNSLRDELYLGGNAERPGQRGVGFGVDFAVISDPVAANSPQGAGTYYWSGAAGTWFWIDPTQDMFWLGMIQAQGQRRPGAANMGNVARDIIYDSLAN
ncbi:MAG: serine hydrolase [Gammaproteobacteria bacterium]|jgi:CubicO group peptidase (beta-lactamase class C family)|nr:serine hydrolase [Gammaproteobacteria bacterium]HJN97221.1 serine hydrolase domain-containing protein [Gammaproteobacteria bacterium]|tara:strand:- start:1986 stop:3305 length:1320 start_codon:yes stop_codon:yes gene_type:complete